MDSFAVHLYSNAKWHDLNDAYDVGHVVRTANVGVTHHICIKKVHAGFNTPFQDAEYWAPIFSDMLNVKTVNDYKWLGPKFDPIKAYFKRLFCRHTELDFVRNIHGDEIIYSGWKRSVWRCKHCTTYKLQDQLHKEETVNG